MSPQMTDLSIDWYNVWLVTTGELEKRRQAFASQLQHSAIGAVATQVQGGQPPSLQGYALHHLSANACCIVSNLQHI